MKINKKKIKKEITKTIHKIEWCVREISSISACKDLFGQKYNFSFSYARTDNGVSLFARLRIRVVSVAVAGSKRERSVGPSRSQLPRARQPHKTQRSAALERGIHICMYIRGEDEVKSLN